MTTRELDSTIRVLLVEDNPGDARLVREMLSEAGSDQFELNVVESLHASLVALSDEDFDVVLLDLSLPDTDGLGTVSEVQQKHPQIPIVVLSGTSDEAMAVQAVQYGAQDYLVKGQGDGRLLARAMRYAIERKQTRERLSFLARHDHLTGLANRTLFRENLSRALAWSNRNQKLVALVFLDLDRFKTVNDTYGHDAGDQLLVDLAQRLRSCVRRTDTVARMGGDEFTVLVEGIPHSQDAAVVAQKIIDTITPPYTIDDQEVTITASLGISVYPLDGEDEVELIRYADMAMYRAKEFGRNNYQFWTSDMNAQAYERLALRESLYRALVEKELRVYYQPQVNLKRSRVVGLEALLRWQHPEFGLVAPEQFINLAEETGMIVPIGEWCLRVACTQATSWESALAEPPRVSVNISPRQFRQRDLVEVVEGALEYSGLSPDRLELELKEDTLWEHAELNSGIFFQLKALGVRITIDNFGTGMFSIRNLKVLPFDVIKIAKAFMDGLGSSPKDTAIIASTIDLARHFNVRVIAEGVEREEQVDSLKEMGCEVFQGYYFSKPMPEGEVTSFVEKFSPDVHLQLE